MPVDSKPIDAAALDGFLRRITRLGAMVGPSQSGRTALDTLAQLLAQLIGRSIGVPPGQAEPRLGFSMVLWSTEADWATWCCNTDVTEHAKRLREFADAIESRRGLN